MYGNAPARSVKTDMGPSLPPEDGVPPISSRQQSQPQTNQLTQTQQFIRSSAPPQNPYPAPHLDAPRPRYGPSDTPSALAIFSSPFPSPPPLNHRAGYAMPQYPPSHMHHPSYTVPPSPPFVFPHHPGSSGGETNMQHLAYTTHSMMSVLQEPYQRRSTDYMPSPHQMYAAGISRQASTASSSEAQRPTSYPSAGTYSPVGYTTPPSFVYPTPFVHSPSIYGSHYPSPHFVRPYGSPPPQHETQGGWWYPPQGAIAAESSFKELRPRSQSHSGYLSHVNRHKDEQSGQTSSASPTKSLGITGNYPHRYRFRSPSDPSTDAAPASTRLTPSSTPDSQIRTEDPPSREGGRDSHQERRSYHPKTPANRSEWVMWAGNVPSDATPDELRVFFNQPPPPPSPSQSGSPTQRVYGGVSTVFLIARSNCAFVNFESEAQLEAATARFHGEPIRPDDPRCPRLVCRVRKRTDDLKAGVGAQRGSSMHVKWIKEQRAMARSHGADSKVLRLAIERSSSPLNISDDDLERSTSPCSSCSGSLATTNSDILSRYFPQRYFILKSLTEVMLVTSRIRSELTASLV
jgi:hypothetical protein